jgi:tetratricopeptide (TPR) repeat protein
MASSSRPPLQKLKIQNSKFIKNSILNFGKVVFIKPGFMYQELYNLGLDKARQGDFAGAIKEFSRAIKINPDFADAYYKRAITRFDFGDLEGAVEDYNQVLQMNPNWIEAYCGRGLARLALGNMQAAIDDATECLRLNPNHAPAYSLRGTACQRLGTAQAAIANLKKAAELYLEQKDAAKCRQCLETIKKLQPPRPAAKSTSANSSFNPEEFINEALKKAMSGQYKSALEDFDWLVQLNPQDDRVYYNRGLIYSRFNHHWNAIEDFNQALRIQPNHAEAYYHRGMARSALKNEAGAIADLNQAANLFRQQGDIANYKQALEDIEKIQFMQKYRQRSYRETIQYNNISRGKPSYRLEQRLLVLVGGHWDTAWRLVDLERERNPGMPEDWYWEKAIYHIERDRGLK